MGKKEGKYDNDFSVADELPLDTCYENGCSDPALKDLAGEIPELLTFSRAPSTIKGYGAAYKRWRKWTDDFPEITPLPATGLHLVLYLLHLAQKNITYQVIVQAVASIKWAHALAGLSSPSNNVFVKEALISLRRKLARPTVRKKPIDLTHIHDLIDNLQIENVTDVRNTTIIVLAFFALLRSDEIRKLKLGDIEFAVNHVTLHIRSSKCDQLRSGDTVLIAKLGGKYCPIKLLEKYLNFIGKNISHKANSEIFLFRRVSTKATGKSLDETNLSLTYSNVRDIVKRKLGKLGLDANSYGTHSMRAGGATIAANNNISDRLLQRHGRWAGASSANRYLEDNVHQKLAVSRVIGANQKKKRNQKEKIK